MYLHLLAFYSVDFINLANYITIIIIIIIILALKFVETQNWGVNWGVSD